MSPVVPLTGSEWRDFVVTFWRPLLDYGEREYPEEDLTTCDVVGWVGVVAAACSDPLYHKEASEIFDYVFLSIHNNVRRSCLSS